MAPLVVPALDASDDAVEVVERKGLGHPDTILSLAQLRRYARLNLILALPVTFLMVVAAHLS